MYLNCNKDKMNDFVRKSSKYSQALSGSEFNENDKFFVDDSLVNYASSFSRTFKPNSKKYKLSKGFSSFLAAKSLQNYLKLRKKVAFEMVENYYDELPLLSLRKAIKTVKSIVSYLLTKIIKSIIFETITLSVIILNTIVLSIDGAFYTNNDGLEVFFIYFYTIECIIKIFAFGLILNKNAYLRDFLNIIDFIIVITSWIDYKISSGVKLNAIRIFRIIRPLKSISSIKGLRSIILALGNSIQPLISALILMTFFILIFAIIGLQLWRGYFSQRCFNVDTGIFSGNLCGAESCPTSYTCINSNTNPNYGTANFDNFLYSLINVFMCITLEGWTTIMNYSRVTFSYYSFIYFVFLEFIGANIVVNLTLAIITSSFCSSFTTEEREGITVEKIEKVYEKIKMMEKICVNKKDKNKIYVCDEKNELVSKVSQRAPGLFKGLPERNSFCNLLDDSSEQDSNLDDHIQGRRIKLSNRSVSKMQSLSDNLNVAGFSINIMQEFNKKSSVSNTLPSKTSDNISAFINYLDQYKETIKVDQKTVENILNENFKFSDLILEVNPDFEFNFTSTSDIKFQKKNLMTQNYYNFSSISDFFSSKSDQSQELENHYKEYQRKIHLFNFLSTLSSKTKAFNIVVFSSKHLIVNLENSAIPEISESYLDVRSDSDIPTIFPMFNFLKSQNTIFSKLQLSIERIIRLKIISWFFSVLIILNTITLSIDHYGISDSLNSTLFIINSIFTYIFLLEMILRLIGLGFTEYFRDKMNFIDSIVVIINIVEFFVISGTSLSAFRVIRVFRIIRVIKIARIFRYLSSITVILRTLSNSLSRFVYLLLFLSILLVVFSLLGMQIFKGNFDFKEGKPRANFENLYSALLTMFQVLSTENWNEVLTSSLRYHPASCIFLIVWIIIGNYVFMNLVLAILIKGFDEMEEQDKDGIFNRDTMKKRMSMFQRENSTVFGERSAMMISWSNIMAINDYSHKSLFLFEQENKFRILCLRIVASKKFDNTIFALIVTSSLKLVWDSYTIESTDSISAAISYYFDLCITIAFGLEFLMKIISMGYACTENSYMSDNWNKLDFIIVILSLIDISLSSINIPAIKVIRLLRTLRPLKLIKHNISMKIVVTALLDSLAAIFNVLLVIIVFWLVFAIIGVGLFAGKLYCCSNTLYETRGDCEKSGFNWKNSRFNYDNIAEAMITLFVVISQESWPNLMNQGIDAKGVDTCPVKNYNPLASIYFISYLVIGNFFLINLFTAVVFEKFNNAKRKTMLPVYTFLNKSQVLWMEMQKLIVTSSPNPEMAKRPSSVVRLKCYQLSKSRIFENFIIIIIVLNTIVMCLPYQNANQSYLNSLDYLSQTCTYIFILEAGIKIIGYGKNYFKRNWNRLDFFVVCCSIAELFMDQFLDTSVSLIKQIPQIIRVVRVLRIVRTTRILQLFMHLQNLVFLLLHSVAAILNVLSLLLLVMFVFAITGVFLFYSVKQGQVIDGFYNFFNFSHAMIIVWRMSTGEDYPSIMMDCVEALGSKFYVIYFIILIITIDFIVLELFVSVILQNYEDFSTNPNSVFKVFNFYYKKFLKIWTKYSQGEGGNRIGISYLQKFTEEVVQEFGKTGDEKTANILKKSLNLEQDSKGFLYFNDVLYQLMKKKFSAKPLFNQHAMVVRFIRKIEENTMQQLKKIRKRVAAEFDERKKEFEQKRDKFFSIVILKKILVNWREYTKRNKSLASCTPQLTEIEFPGFNSFNSM